jgi:hypothetical protein
VLKKGSQLELSAADSKAGNYLQDFHCPPLLKHAIMSRLTRGYNGIADEILSAALDIYIGP